MSDLYDNMAVAALAGELGAEDLAEWHGTVTGVLCAAPPAELTARLAPFASPGAAREAVVPADAGGDGDKVPVGAGSVPAATDDEDAAVVIDRTRAALGGETLAFEPLLLADVPLTERALALAAWCQGFLYGLATAQPDFAARLDDDGREIVDDFGAIALAVRGGDDVEEAESAYAELFEFVRVGVLLIFEHLRAARQGAGVAATTGPGNGHDQSA
jgi:uncharacterized protein YgfB (UPF0149 family)